MRGKTKNPSVFIAQGSQWGRTGTLVLSSLIFLLFSSMASLEELHPALKKEALKIPPENPLTAEKAKLGRKLFFDPILSRSRQISCASCHVPGLAFSNGVSVATGEGGAKGDRNVPVIFNRVFSESQFWDARAKSLEQQVLQPIQNKREMGIAVKEAIARLRKSKEYSKWFLDVFPGEGLTSRSLSFALASYVRTLVSLNSAYDRHLAGNRNALSPIQQQGMDLFFNKFRCNSCHSGPNFTNEQLSPRCTPESSHVFGYPESEYKTPTLRNLARSYPYLHNGSLGTVREVLEFYQQSRHEAKEGTVAISMTKEEMNALEAFLISLEAEVEELKLPE